MRALGATPVDAEDPSTSDLFHTIIDSLEKQTCDAERREPRPTADGVVRRTDRTHIAADNTMHRTQPKDEADEAGEQSFPGSDAPPWWTGQRSSERKAAAGLSPAHESSPEIQIAR